MPQNDLVELGNMTHFFYNGHGWDIQHDFDIPEKIVFFQNHQKILENYLDSKKNISYICIGEYEKFDEEILSDNVYIGVPNIADNSAMYYQCINEIKKRRITFQNIFSEGLMKGFYDEIPNAILVTNERNISRYNNVLMKKLTIGNNWELAREMLFTVQGNEINKKIFFIDLDQDTSKIILKLTQEFPGHTYVDARFFPSEIGGSTGIRWMFHPEKVHFDIDVILTLYKKPEALKLQIDALRRQTLRPASLSLYQDGIESGYRIVLTESMEKEFDDIKVSDTNKGVWERFRWAKKSNSHYVCVFDDDTIPGNRWLESCHVHMQEETAVYGTNGVLLSNLKDYPMGGALGVGWHVANVSKRQVDLVGHSWFFQKCLLDYVPEESEDLNKYKYTGEDMFLSYQALEHGQKTYAPPHPLRYPELWGSIPKFGWKFGAMEGALSIVHKNNVIRNEFMKKLISSGWNPILTYNPKYIKDIEAELRENDVCQQIRKMLIEFILMGNVFIYGAGSIAKKIWEFVARNHLCINGFVVSKAYESEYEGQIIMPIDTLLKTDRSQRIILGLSEQYHAEIRDKLSCLTDTQIFPKADAVFSYRNFVEALD